jgi:hypothetical protein
MRSSLESDRQDLFGEVIVRAMGHDAVPLFWQRRSSHEVVIAVSSKTD